MKIAVIDSGININMKDFQNKSIEFINLLEDGQSDDNGHGTASVGEILNINYNVNIIAIRILNRVGQCKLSKLVEALKICLLNDEIKIVCLGMICKIDDESVISYLEDIVNQYYLMNKVLLCAISNDGIVGYPSAFKNVISIQYDYLLEDKEYYSFNRESYKLIYHAPTRIMPFSNRYMFFKGNSCATAKMTGVLSKYINIDMKFVDIMEVLNLYQYKILKFGVVEECRAITMEKLEYVIKLILKHVESKYSDKISKNDNINTIMQYFNSEEKINILHYLEKVYNVNLNLKSFTSYDFLDINNLYRKLNNI